MIGIHDLGGRQGFGEIPKDDMNFRADWERITFALSVILRMTGVTSLDNKRHVIEQLQPVDYLALSYYGRWLLSTETIYKDKGVIETGAVGERMTELQSGEYTMPETENPNLSQSVRESFESDRFGKVDDGPAPVFNPGDHVVVTKNYSQGHTRAPRYVQGAHGKVADSHGTFYLPDAEVEDKTVAEPVYSVIFTHSEVWGDGHPDTDTIAVDLWESYIERAEVNHQQAKRVDNR